MILDFSLTEVMRLSNIKRWGIIEMSREQSVAEHSYNVAMISMAIYKNLEFDSPINESQLICWALYHDLPELYTGDIPTPVKKYLDLDSFDNEVLPLYAGIKQLHRDSVIDQIVKAADYIEAIQFAEKFCVDSRGPEIIRDIQKNMTIFLSSKCDVLVAAAVEKVLDEQA